MSETTLTWLPMISQRDHGYYWFLGWPGDRVYILQKNQQKRECIYQIPELLWLSILIRLRFHLCSSASPRLKRQVAPAFLYQGLLTTARLLEHSPSLCLAIFCLFRSSTREKFKEASPNLSFPVNYMSLKPKSSGWWRRFFIPYINEKLKELSAPETPWLLVSDVFKGQWTEAVKSVVKESNGKMVPVPNNWINYFQPLDLTVNKSSKDFLRNEAQNWYSQEIMKQMQVGKLSNQIKVNVRISVFKPLHAKLIAKYLIMQGVNQK